MFYPPQKKKVHLFNYFRKFMVMTDFFLYGNFISNVFRLRCTVFQIKPKIFLGYVKTGFPQKGATMTSQVCLTILVAVLRIRGCVHWFPSAVRSRVMAAITSKVAIMASASLKRNLLTDYFLTPNVECSYLNTLILFGDFFDEYAYCCTFCIVL